MNQSCHGLLVLDKPAGITSRDAVNRAQRWFPPRTKIGHTGTLDPLATGVLVLCIGQATRLAEFVQEMDKTYRATFKFGARSDTDDADGVITATGAAKPIDESKMREALQRFVGAIEQIPPHYSAIKIDGQRAHDLARRGKATRLEPRTIRIDGIEMLHYDWPELEIEVRCGKGTYIRSVARDLGEQLGIGGYVAQLRRTRVGSFRAEEGVSLDVAAEEATARLRPVEDALSELPRVELPEIDARHFENGGEVAFPAGGANDRQVLAVFEAGGGLVGVGCVPRPGRLRALKNLRI